MLEQAILRRRRRPTQRSRARQSRPKLAGVGSLIVREADSDEDGVPGNMFVPIDALKPILTDLAKTGQRGPARPWLGVSAKRSRVGSEAAFRPRAWRQAGIRGIVLAVGGEGVRTQAEFTARCGIAAPMSRCGCWGIDVRGCCPLDRSHRLFPPADDVLARVASPDQWSRSDAGVVADIADGAMLAGHVGDVVLAARR
jgi:hypothetical protein